MGRTIATILAAMLLWLTAAAPAGAEWRRAESPHFIVHGENGEARLRERVAELEDFHQLLRNLTGTADDPAAAKLSIYLVHGMAELRQIWPRADASVGGFYAASGEGILAVVDSSADRAWAGRNEVLFHEYSHHFMLQHFPAVYPQWYIEGFAEYLATARLEGDTIEYGRANPARASWLANRSGWLPMEQLLFSSPERIGRASQFYAQSWLLVHYLLRDAARMRQLNRYLGAVSQGRMPRAAFEEAFGITPSQMQRQLSAYSSLEMTFTRVRRESGAQRTPVTVTVLPPSAQRLVLLDAAMTSGVHLDADAFVRRVRHAAGTPSDPFARRVLARAEALYGDGAVAERLLAALLEASPRDAELLYLMGMRHLTAGRREPAGRAAHFRAAQGWFVRAHRADENHYPTLFRYAESLSGDEAVLMSDNTTNILLLAQQIAPQAHAIRLSTANLLMRRRRWADAEELLTPLASHPHGGAMTRTAQALLAKARAEDNDGLPGVFELPAEDD